MEQVNTDTEIAIIENWLRNKHTTLWMNWDVTDTKERRLAAEWVRDLMTELELVLRYEQWIPTCELSPT
jgi:hypothetical protein